MVDNSRARTSTNKTYALALAQAGLYVFVSSGKTPLVPRFNKIDTQLTTEEREIAIEEFEAKHDGEQPVHVGATKDPAVIKKMFRKYPNAVTSLACGPNKLVVIDADQKDNGPELIGKHFEERGLPEGCVVIPTQSGGRHYIFSDPDGQFTNSAGALKKQYGCDLRGKNGQYVAPGSIREDGKTYGTKKDLVAFLRAYTGGQLPLLPDHVVELIGTAGEASQSVNESALDPVIKELEEDWPEHEELIDPAIGIYDLEGLKSSNPEFAELYDNPTSDCSDNRWKFSQTILQEFKMPVTHLAVLYEGWEGAGTQTDDGKGSGRYNLRDIAREWLKNKDRFKATGDAFGSVADQVAREDAEYEAAKAKKAAAEVAEIRGALYYANNLASYTQANYIVENMCTPGQLGVIYGASNVGKTFAVIHLGDCVAEGAPWFGKQTEQSGVLYLFAEGKDQFNNRLAAYRKKYPSDGKGMLVHKGIPPLSTPAGVKAFGKAIDEGNKWQEENGLPPIRLTFVDTFAKAVAGADENSAKEMQPILNALRKMAEEKGVCVIIVHHTGKDLTAGSRGSYVIFADVEFELEMFDHATAKKKKLKVIPATDQIAIYSDKLRDGGKGGMMLFRLEEVTLGKNKWGRPATSVVVVPIMPSEGAAMGAVTDDEPGDVKDELTPDLNRQAEEKRVALCQKIVEAMKPIARINGEHASVTVAEIVERVPALAKLKAEGGPQNFARNLREAVLGSEPKVLLPEGWLEYVPATGRKSSLFTFTHRRAPG